MGRLRNAVIWAVKTPLLLTSDLLYEASLALEFAVEVLNGEEPY